MSSPEPIRAIQCFSQAGMEYRIEWQTLSSGNKVIKFYGLAPIEAPTSLDRWYITFLEYDSTECNIRGRTFGTQKKWDDRASLFP